MKYIDEIKHIQENWQQMGEERFNQSYRPESLECNGFYNGVTWLRNNLLVLLDKDKSKLQKAFNILGVSEKFSDD